MSYITSKKTFPVAMIGFPLTEKAIKDRRSVIVAAFRSLDGVPRRRIFPQISLGSLDSGP
jgi:hypothetical protein